MIDHREFIQAVDRYALLSRETSERLGRQLRGNGLGTGPSTHERQAVTLRQYPRQLEPVSNPFKQIKLRDNAVQFSERLTSRCADSIVNHNNPIANH
jgi:hypothetical protein